MIVSFWANFFYESCNFRIYDSQIRIEKNLLIFFEKFKKWYGKHNKFFTHLFCTNHLVEIVNLERIKLFNLIYAFKWHEFSNNVWIY